MSRPSYNPREGCQSHAATGAKAFGIGMMLRDGSRTLTGPYRARYTAG